MVQAGRTPLQLRQSTTNLLNLLLFLKIFLLVTSISFISVALFGKEEQIGSKHVAMRDRKFLLQSGLYVGCVSLVSGLSIIQAPKDTSNFSILILFMSQRSRKRPGHLGFEALAPRLVGALPRLLGLWSNVFSLLHPRGHLHFWS